jgi:hypothetical protein
MYLILARCQPHFSQAPLALGGGGVLGWTAGGGVLAVLTGGGLLGALTLRLPPHLPQPIYMPPVHGHQRCSDP